MIRILLIRHGHTAWNLVAGQGQRFRGTVDVPLADEGIVQAQITAQRLAKTPLAAVYTSPLQRAARTAQIIAEPHGLSAQEEPGLSSMDYGDWAGELHADVIHRWPEVYRQWRENPFDVQIPGGDRPADLRARAVAALHEILDRHADGDTVALISHQVVTRTLACVLAGVPDTGWWNFSQDLCNLSVFDYDRTSGEFALVSLNDTCHLTQALPDAGSDETRLVLVRHGQTAWNAGAGEERFRGRMDLPLDDTGLKQAKAIGNRLIDKPIAAIYTSPLQRTRQTATPLSVTLNQPVCNNDLLLDIDYGEFQGLTHTKAAKAYPEQYALWRTAPSQVHFPGGECLSDVQARLLRLLDELAAQHPAETVALFGHQIVNKVLACTLLGLDLDQIWRINQDAAGLNIYQWVSDRWHTLRINDVYHLA
jgi:broad specificity phosphatase PhoE